MVKAQYISVWDGGVTIATDCLFDVEANEVYDIESVDVDGLDICEREYVLLPDGTEIECQGGEVL